MTMLAALMFLSGFLADLFWALYIRHLSKGNRLKASAYSVVIGICSVIMVEGIVSGGWLAVFWLTGLFCGTYYASEVERIAYETWENIKNFWRN